MGRLRFLLDDGCALSILLLLRLFGYSHRIIGRCLVVSLLLCYDDGCRGVLLFQFWVLIGFLFVRGYRGLFLFGDDLCRLVKQVCLDRLHWGEVLQIELVVVAIGILGTQQREVLLADEIGARLTQKAHNLCLMQYVVGIEACLVVITETCDLHEMDAVAFFDVDIKVADKIGCEVELRHLEEQLVLVDRVGLIGKEEHEVGLSLWAEGLLCSLLVLIEYGAASLPYVLQVELAAMETFSGIDSIDYHTSHLAESALRIFLNQGLHICHASLRIALVQLAQSADKDKLVTVGAHGETGGRYIRVGQYRLVFPQFESLVGRSIERVFYVDTKLGIVGIVGVGKKCGPLTLWVFLLESLYIGVGCRRHVLA